MRHFVFFALLLCVAACTPSIQILTPGEGAMLETGQDVAVLVEAQRGSVLVNGAGASSLGSGRWSATVAEVAGLGLAAAEVEGTDAVAVRSWHQGSFAEPGAAQASALQLGLGPAALCEGEPSVCALVDAVIEGHDLVGFVDNPLDVSGVEITVESAVAAEVTVLVEPAEAPTVTLSLGDLVADYSADAWIYQSTGTASFEAVVIEGTLGFVGAEASLEVTEVEASDAVVEDSGGLPSSVIDLLADALQAEMESAMADAAAAATGQVVGDLLAQASPLPAVDFEAAVLAQAEASAVQGSTDGLSVAYDALCQAEAPVVAGEGQGFLLGSEAAVTPGSSALSVALGSPLLDALAFAAWDAGNLEGMVFTREELEAGGMPTLDFPYDHFEEAELRLALPPLLAWREDGPWLDVGGVVAELSIQTSKDAILTTAARVPVLLEEGEGGLFLRPDPDRALELEPLGFDELNELADPEQASTLVEAAIPAVLERVFGDLPAVTLPELVFSQLDGSEGPGIVLKIETVASAEGRWLLELDWAWRK